MNPPSDGAQISVKELAALANNLTPQRIYQLVSEGHLPPLADGLLPRDASIRALFKFYQRDSEELKRERLLHVTACRKAKEIELAQMEGKLISYDHARTVAISFVRDLKTLIRREIEKAGPARRREKLSELGVSDEITQQFSTFDTETEIAAITRMERYATAKSKECSNELNKDGQTTPQENDIG
jgi:hypothetical protein